MRSPFFLLLIIIVKWLKNDILYLLLGLWGVDMKKGQLSTTEVLKFIRHDYLNELQIILMHIDLDNKTEAKEKILALTDEMRQYSKLTNLKLPQTEEWFTTFDWVYTSFRKTLSCTIGPNTRTVDDSALVLYLKCLFQGVEEVLNPASEYEVHFHIETSEKDWSLQVTIMGELQEGKIAPKIKEGFIVEETISHNLWTFTIRGR